MNTYTQKTIWIRLIIKLSFMFALLFAANAYAVKDPVVADIESAYSFYSGVTPDDAPLNTDSNNSTDNALPTTQAQTPPAPQGAAGGLGGIANNLMGPVEIVASFLVSMALVAGFICLVSGFLRYMQHRANPLAHPIGTVATLVVLGIILLLLPLIYKFTDSGIPFALH